MREVATLIKVFVAEWDLIASSSAFWPFRVMVDPPRAKNRYVIAVLEALRARVPEIEGSYMPMKSMVLVFGLLTVTSEGASEGALAVNDPFDNLVVARPAATTRSA